MSERFTIRRADQKDVRALSLILTASWKQAYQNILSAEELETSADAEKYEKIFLSLTEKHSNRFYIAHCNDFPCGMLYSCPSRDAELKGFAEIVAIYILPEFWGQGLGQALMNKVLQEISPFYAGVCLWVFKDNLRARRFYEKSGFSPDGREKTEKFSNQPVSVRYRKVLCVNPALESALPDGAHIARTFFNPDNTRRILIYRRKEGTFSYTDQALLYDEYEQSYYWQGKDSELSFYESEESVLRDISHLLEGMTEYREQED